MCLIICHFCIKMAKQDNTNNATQLQGRFVVGVLALAMIKLCSKFEIYVDPL